MRERGVGWTEAGGEEVAQGAGDLDGDDGGYLLAEIDAAARQVGSNRSKFLAAAAREALDNRGAASARP